MTPTDSFDLEDVTRAATLNGWRYHAARRAVGGGSVIGAGPGFPDVLLWKTGRMLAVWLAAEAGAPLDAVATACAESLALAGVEIHVWGPGDCAQLGPLDLDEE